MQSVTFTLERNLSADDRHRVLESVKGLGGVVRADAVNPNSPNPDVQRLGYADVDEAANLDEIVNAIGALPEVESAEPPPARKLVRTT